jgi:hypothetical protein
VLTTHPRLQYRLSVERRLREIRDAERARVALSTRVHPARRPVRRAVGRSLVSLGHRLAGEPDAVISPARPR